MKGKSLARLIVLILILIFVYYVYATPSSPNTAPSGAPAAASVPIDYSIKLFNENSGVSDLTCSAVNGVYQKVVFNGSFVDTNKITYRDDQNVVNTKYVSRTDFTPFGVSGNYFNTQVYAKNVSPDNKTMYLYVFTPDGALYAVPTKFTDINSFTEDSIAKANVDISPTAPGVVSLCPGGSVNVPCKLVQQNDCNLVIYDGTNKALWATGTNRSLDRIYGGALSYKPGFALVSKDGRFSAYFSANRTIILADRGNVYKTVGVAGAAANSILYNGGVLLADGTKLFTASQTGSQYLTMQTDGNLVVYLTANNAPVWASGTMRA